MARPVVIRRSFFQPNVGSTSGFYQAGILSPGETLTRVLLNIQFTYVTNVPLEMLAGVGLWGVSINESDFSAPTLDLETDANSDGWLWWEGVGWRNYAFRDDGTQPTVDAAVAPADGGYRQIKAQRKALSSTFTNVWFQHKNLGPNVIPWTPAITASLFVLLPA